MKPSVILYKALPEDLQKRLEEHFTVTQVKNLSPETVVQHADAFASAEGLLGSSEKVDIALLEKMPKLRATSTVSVGYDNFDVDALSARKILLMHTPHALTETVADTLMALVLSTARRVVEVGWLSSVPYLAATIAMIVASWASDKLQNRKVFVWPLLLIAAFAFIGSWAVGANHFWASYTLLVIAGAAMYAPYGPFFAIIPEMLPRNVAGGAMALINSMGALGSFCGSWFVGYLNGATGSPSASYIFMGVALFASVWLTLIVKPANNQQLPVGARHA